MENVKKGYWFSTESGAHVFVEEGQSKEQAMNQAFDGKTSKPSLVGKNGQVVKDADGDGVENEKSKTYKGMRELLKKNGYPVDDYSDEEVDSAFVEFNKSIDDQDDKARQQRKEKLNEGGKQPYSKELEKHNKIIDSINNNYSKMSKEEYWKKMDEEVDRFNAIQEKYSREEINGEADEDDIWDSFEKGEITEKERNQKLSDRTKNLVEHDFNDPSERASLKVEEKNIKKQIFDQATKNSTKKEYDNLINKGYSKEQAIEKIASKYDSDDDRIFESKEYFDKKHKEYVKNVKEMLGFNELQSTQKFTPTKQTIWDDPKHPLYGISPSEQNEEYLSDAINEMKRYSSRWSYMNPTERRNIASGGKKELDKKLAQYQKALEYIKKGDN